ncbi:hypothetical protein LMG26411_06329 [Cupriavidus numazuensis]|uniref:Uncharacterized protein n=2 Tax=Cupriavidus numazuensis TaxID=221992 RepID=A0ABN7Q714_9BURK|nr:hypothetical protein LMG26411_06329 [Cupriavidus numazuensis]
MKKTYRSIRSNCRMLACTALAVTAGLGMRTAFAFTPIGNDATGSSTDLVIGDNAKGDATPTYFWIVPDTDPAGKPVPAVGSTIVGNYANANEYAGVTLFGDHTYATGNGAVAFGPNASAGTVGTAVGNDSMAGGKWSLAFGARSYAPGYGSMALGGLSSASGDYSNAVGVLANASGYGSFAGGYASASGWGGIAIGLGATQADDNGIALGALANAGGTSSVAIGNGAHTSSADAIALGRNASALGDRSISIGTGSTVTGARSGAIGDPNTVTGSGSYALGNDNNIGADNAFVVGNNVTVAAGLNGAVVLGNGSTVSAATPVSGITINGVTYTFAGASPAAGDVVSVGSETAPRQIQNVAAGQISATSTDAINGSQLYATNQAIEQMESSITVLDQGSVKYDTNADGTINYNSVTMGGDTYNAVTKTGGTRITNVARGVNDSDAVNMSQLNETNAVINNFAGDQSDTYTEQNGRGIRYVRTNDMGLAQADAYAQAQGATAVGYAAQASGDNALALGRNAVASEANSVALGAGSVTAAAVATASGVVGGTTYQFAGAAPASTVSVGSAGNERTVTNVAAGRISGDSTDAINGSQLYATNQKVNENTQDIANLNQQVGGNTQAITNLNNRIDGVQRDANAGTASAMALAGLPQSVLPGKGMVALAGSTYSGQSALALGVSTLSDSGRWVFKGGVTSNTRGNVGATIGAGFHW